jgi:N-acyl homoserine lactone hydrolase
MKIHAIQTGTVAVKTRQPEGRGHGTRRLLNTFFDREWTEPLPIYAFAIEHPEGVIVVDTGDTARTAEPGYFPRWHPYFRFGVRLSVEPEQEIGPQLRELGIEQRDVRKVVLTHLHTDHAGGLHHFPESEMLVSRAELELASGGVGRIRGYPNNRWPSWFHPAPLDLPEVAFGPFPQSLPLTEAGDVTIVGLAGHTPGHIGVAVDEGEQVVLLAGDSSYNLELMVRGVVDGVSPDENAARRTIERIQTLARERPTVYLVAHDPDTGTRLAERRAV